MARLALSLLGSFQVHLEGKSIADFESDRVRALLAYLAVEAQRPHRRDALAALLWPDWPQRSALTNLRNALSNLRKAIGDRVTAAPVLLVNRETIQFDLTSDCAVDVQTFRSLTATEPTASHLEHALELYRAPFLDGFGLDDSALFEEWVQNTREQLQRQCLATLDHLAEHCEQRGDLTQAIEYAWRQIDLAPWQEQAHQRVMRLLALSGNRNAALAQYETCRRMLQQELNVEPSPETVALYERIRDGDLGQPANAPALTRRQSTLPVWLTPFVGREDMLAEITERLQDPNCRLLTLLGPGGSGKTRLAAETAARLVNIFPQGIHFVPLASLLSPENIVPAIAHVLGFSFQEQDEPLQQLLRYLRQKTLLLILDNFEHLISSPEPERENGTDMVSALLQAAPALKVIVTSRVGLNVQGEYILAVPGMGYPEQSAAASDVLTYSAVQLFIQDARRVRPGFDPNGDDLVQIVEICRLVQGMPLGILLAAAWMQMLSPAEIASKLAAHKLDFLESEWRDVPERQRSMRAVFDYSWRLLNERERQVLAGLSVFRGGFTFTAAQPVAKVDGTSATLRDLMGLINSSMLQRAPTGRYEIHELLRQYAEEKLRASSDGEQATRDRHATHFTTALRRWATDLQTTRQPDALAELDAEHNNVRAAWSWAIKHGQINSLADGMTGLGLFCDWRARYKEGEKAFRAVAENIAANDSAQSIEELKLWASALAWQARFNQRLGRVESARELAQESLDALEELTLDGEDVRQQRARALEVIGEIELQLGNCVNGREPLAQSLALYRELNDRRSVANCLRSFGRLAERMGNYEWAAQMHQESVEISRALGTQRDTVDALLDLYVDLQCLGRYDESSRLLLESQTICEKMGDRAALTAVRYRMAMDQMDGSTAESLAILEECVAAYADLGDRHRQMLALMRAGEAQMYLGRYDQARTALRESLTWYRDVDNRWGIGAALRLLTELSLAQGRYAEASQLAQEGIVAFRRSGARADVGWALACLGAAAAALREFDQARQALAEALDVALEFRHRAAPMHVLSAATLLAAEQGRAVRAVELWAAAAEYASVFMTARSHQDIYRQHIAPVVESLPRDVIAAAEERGRVVDVWTVLEELRREITFPSD
jgi:predicted ATPase/DNA-binding SARP family transcriptional activator